MLASPIPLPLHRAEGQNNRRAMKLLTAENRGTSAHVREPDRHLAEKDECLKLRIDIDLIHNPLLFLPHRKLVKIIRAYGPLCKLDYSEHFGFARHMTFV